MSNRQFVACKFRPGDRRSYTHHWDGEPLAPGDEVKVPDKSGEGWSRVLAYSLESFSTDMEAAADAKAYRSAFWAVACEVDHRMGACI